MAHAQLEGRVPLVAASPMAANVPIGPEASGVSETIKAAASWGDFHFGITAATVVSGGDPIAWWQPGDVGKGIAGASIGAFGLVAVGSTNGVLAPLGASGLSTAMGSALGAGPPRWALGWALKNAAAGDIFPVFISPRQVI